MASHGSAATGARLTDPRLFDVWAAGYADGEGCFSYDTTPRVNVTNTYPWALLALQRAYGGTVAVKKDRRKKSRPQFEWNIYGEKALACVARILPFLFEKRRQAEILVEVRAFPARSVARQELCAELKTLKRIRYE